MLSGGRGSFSYFRSIFSVIKGSGRLGPMRVKFVWVFLKMPLQCIQNYRFISPHCAKSSLRLLRLLRLCVEIVPIHCTDTLVNSNA